MQNALSVAQTDVEQTALQNLMYTRLLAGNFTINASGVVSFAFSGTFADGTVNAPGIAFTSETTSGRYRIGAANFGESILGTRVFDWNASRISVAADLLFTDATFDIGKAGATRPRDLFLSRNLAVGGSVVSDLLFTDATFDIGKSAATRPRDLFLSRNLTIGGNVLSDLLFADATFDIGKAGATRPRDVFLSRNLAVGGNVISDLLFTDATFDIGKTGATRPRDGFFSRNLNVGGTLGVNGVAYTWPGADGTAGQILQTNGSKVLSWSSGWTVVSTTSTGAQNDFSPGLVRRTVLRCNNATLLTISGFSGGTDGDQLRIVSVGAGQVDLVHQATSTAANQLLNTVTTGNTSLAPGTGSAEYVYDGTTTRWRLIGHEQGNWITRTFAAGNYTATSGTWTVASATRDAFYVKGRTLYFAARVSGTTSATPAQVNITLPNSYSWVGGVLAAGVVENNGSGTQTGGLINLSTTTLGMQLLAGGSFGTGTVAIAAIAISEIT